MDRNLRSWLQTPGTILRRNTTSTDPRGNEVYTYDALKEVLGKFEYLSGDEDLADRDVANVSSRFIVNGDTDIKTEDRLQIDTRTFNINHVNIRYDLKGKEHHRVAFLEEVDGGPT